MAGIGFELKKLFRKKGIAANIKAYIYSTIVTIGPTIICILVVSALNVILRNKSVAMKDIEILQGTITYSFIFSLVLCSGYTIIITRYLADKIYEKNYEDIIPSMIGALTIIVTIGGIIGIIFYGMSPLNKVYKIFAYTLFIQLIVETTISSYISALRSYKKISMAFILGFVIALISSIYINKSQDIDIILNVLICFNIGFFVVNIMLFYEIQRYFSVRSKKYFEFLKYFKSCKPIFFSNLFWFLGLYIHNFVMWTVPQCRKIVGQTYIYAPSYDVPAFYAFITVMPTMVMFVVKLETAFFSKYKNYFDSINKGACYEDIEKAKGEMKTVLTKEIIYIMEIQLLFSLGIIIFAMKIFPILGFTVAMIDLFNILTLSYYCAVIMFIIMTILLYYEDRKGACMSSSIFCFINLLATIITVILGQPYYGVGLFIGSIVSLIFSIFRLRYFVNNIDYYVFCKYSAWKQEES